MRLAVMVCAQDEAVRCQDQLPWFLNFFGLRAGRILHQVEKGEGVENAGWRNWTLGSFACGCRMIEHVAAMEF